MKIVLQVLVGLALCTAAGYVLIYYSQIPLLWEHEERLDPGVYSLTWRSGVMLVLLMTITQVVSYILFRRIRIGREST